MTVPRKDLPKLLGVTSDRVSQLIKENKIVVGISEADFRKLRNRDTEPGRPKKGAKKS